MRLLQRLIGILLVIIAAGSLLASTFALVQVWRLRPTVTVELQSNLQVISGTLSTTSDVLLIAAETLTSTQASISGMEETVTTLGGSIDDTMPMMKSLTALMRKDLPDTISSAQTSLGSAQQSAKIIDAVLRALTFFNPSLYKPSVPLDQALGQVSQSLSGLPESFKTIELGLVDTQINMTTTKIQIGQIAGQIRQINSNLNRAQTVVLQYQHLLADMQARISKWHQRIPMMVDALAWGLSFVLFWLGVFQIDLLLRLLGWVRSG